ncbi:hypothetical protein GCM10023191_063290 [Actinoallomurus oryzae]|uniref:Uncharacterized protein n=1 Tax=Actinoallomurus oryzae TaxID=502180 RepID=A0ABP8QMX2_9ACTN
MPEFSDADKAMITGYVNNRLANGDDAFDINRDLQKHWRQMDAEAAKNAQAAQPTELPSYAPLPEFHVIGSGVTAHESAESAAHFAGPLSNAEVGRLIQAGRSVREIQAMIRQRGVARR